MLDNNQDILNDLSVKNTSISSDKRFQIYKNNVWLEVLDSLHNTFPVVYGLVGKDFFKGCAYQFFKKHPPQAGDLNLYGKNFSEFLSTIESLKAYPYMSDIAKLEWVCHICCLSEKEPICGKEDFMCLPQDEFLNLKIHLQPHLYVQYSKWPIDKVWMSYHQNILAHENIDMSQQDSYMLIFKDTKFKVMLVSCEKSLYTFMKSLLLGQSLALSAEKALDEDQNFQLHTSLTFLFQHQLISGFSVQGEENG